MCGVVGNAICLIGSARIAWLYMKFRHWNICSAVEDVAWSVVAIAVDADTVSVVVDRFPLNLRSHCAAIAKVDFSPHCTILVGHAVLLRWVGVVKIIGSCYDLTSMIASLRAGQSFACPCRWRCPFKSLTSHCSSTSSFSKIIGQSLRIAKNCCSCSLDTADQIVLLPRRWRVVHGSIRLLMCV